VRRARRTSEVGRRPGDFTDAADVTSSRAIGDSSTIIRALRGAGYGKRVLAPIFNEPAAPATHEADVGVEINLALGGSIDAERSPPLTVRARVKLLPTVRHLLGR
jgi:microcystin degradation protein MlrC